jgi:hypothetical protein
LQLRFTPRSRRDLDDVWDYIACDSVDDIVYIDRVLNGYRDLLAAFDD